MDAGLAALLGAGVGGLLGAGGTLGSSYLTGRLQGRGQHAQWRRQGRREAYSNFIAALTAFRHQVDRCFFAVESEQGLTVEIPQLEALWPAVRAALPVVAVEGPRSVADQAAKLERHAEELVVLLDMSREEQGPYLGNAHGHLVEINRGLPVFADLARQALDQPDSSTLQGFPAAREGR
ncbi:hypothetical protein [Streptomyces sp. NPDC005302]|uniref:hypothetical protein n=1 Tax=Streptomyces sp. NPDC005302 TaxID=3154675 RepID=UPI0033A89D4D